jgi:periodic tryptophan protein 1
LSADEYTRIKALAEIEESTEKANGLKKAVEDKDDDEAEGAAATEVEEDDTELPPELRMEDYDEDEVGGDRDDDVDGDMADTMALMDEGNDLALVADAEADEEDAEDDEIRPTDAMLVLAMTEDDYSHLEIQLLSEEGNMFVHHDINLPDFPLSLAWMDCPPFRAEGGQMAVGNYIAVGTFNPAIEIWNLDVLDPLEPTAVLGGEDPSVRPKKGQDAALVPGSHEDAVMGLSWNRMYRQALASGSADKTVKIWDTTTQQCSHTFTHHADKVQSVSWHMTEAYILATGSFDKTISLLDCRSGSQTNRYSVSSDVESMTWDPFNPYHLYTSLESGEVTCFDLRYTANHLYSFKAHDKTTSSISFSNVIPGMFATASVDKSVRVWDISPAYGSNGASANSISPQLVAYKSMNVGELFALQYSCDEPFLLATGGDKGMVAVWESDEQELIQQHFSNREKPDPVESSEVASHMERNAADIGSNAVANSVIAGKGMKSTAVVEEDDSWMDMDDEDSIPEKKKKKDKSKKNKKKGAK